MVRSLGTILVAMAIYGFSAGSVDSLRMALWTLAKFPLVIYLTSTLCALAWWVLARFLTSGLSFRATLGLALRTFADASVMLASLAPVNLFLGRTIVQPTPDALNEYPLYQGLNVLFVAVCGTVAVVRQVCRMQKVHHLTRRRAAGVAAAWLAVSLFVGGQCAWFLRPLYGCSAFPGVPFILGNAPVFRGARSFYEAGYFYVNPPPLP